MPSSLDRGGWAVPNQKVRFKRTRFSRSLTRGNSESQVRTKWVPGDSHQMLKSFATVTVQGSLANMSGLTCRLPPVHMLSLFFSLSHTHTDGEGVYLETISSDRRDNHLSQNSITAGVISGKPSLHSSLHASISHTLLPSNPPIEEDHNRAWPCSGLH